MVIELNNIHNKQLLNKVVQKKMIHTIFILLKAAVLTKIKHSYFSSYCTCSAIYPARCLWCLFLISKMLSVVISAFSPI